MKALVASAAAGVLVLAAFPVLLASGDAEATAPACSVGLPAAGELKAVAATIRERESGGDYRARSPGSTASGAYQFTDATWAGYGGYPRAWLAPPEVQDAKAAEHVSGILAAHGGDVAAVPVVWYLGYLPPAGDPAWDTVPSPESGNVLTPRQYQAEWLAAYAEQTTAGPGAESGPERASPCPPDFEDGGAAPAAMATVEGITVHARIAPAVAALVQAARADGYELTGTGYRSPQQQIDLRRQNCGSSRYAVFEMPSSQCSPPTARPGRSMHERGLAIDFSCDGVLIRTRSSACYQWLADHASDYGLRPLDSEPWHWSSNGR